jgi:hypothetical protein
MVFQVAGDMKHSHSIEKSIDEFSLKYSPKV